MSRNKVLVLGASEYPHRYSNLCMRRLKEAGYDVVAVGKKKGNAHGIEIQPGLPAIEGVDVITIYMSVYNQIPMHDYILCLQPEKIIFNPGAANLKLQQMASEKGIETVNGCTLVMIGLGEI